MFQRYKSQNKIIIIFFCNFCNIFFRHYVDLAPIQIFLTSRFAQNFPSSMFAALVQIWNGLTIQFQLILWNFAAFLLSCVEKRFWFLLMKFYILDHKPYSRSIISAASDSSLYNICKNICKNLLENLRLFWPVQLGIKPI